MTAAYFFRHRMTSAVPHEFNRRAAQYERNAPIQREAADWLAQRLPDEIDGPALELGAGTGLFTKHLVGRACHLIATDIAPRMVQEGSDAMPSAEWAVADATSPPSGRNYRWIFSCSLVQWLPDPVAAFRAWHRASAPGARLLSGWFVRGTLREFFATCPEASPFPWRSADEWSQMLALAGWQTERSEVRTFRRHYADSAAMLREIHNAGAVVPRRMGTGKLRKTMREYDRTHRSEDGVPATFQFLRLEAVRS